MPAITTALPVSVLGTKAGTFGTAPRAGTGKNRHWDGKSRDDGESKLRALVVVFVLFESRDMPQSSKRVPWLPIMVLKNVSLYQFASLLSMTPLFKA